eukprot:CAMPEP_0172015162 /NCGR_PEP_ID=MMETSP1041-20130122/10328_1 /TAXON_ID=464988 /ORGANISM="Hemiselmis andersenii, Strain CCMP439" /LENGTH=125 /DNA_ID=CAMNT_0012669995 /DNA_START=348 /DNA_END=725 /DNA_ORIENTATION=-
MRGSFYLLALVLLATWMLEVQGACPMHSYNDNGKCKRCAKTQHPDRPAEKCETPGTYLRPCDGSTNSDTSACLACACPAEHSDFGPGGSECSCESNNECWLPVGDTGTCSCQFCAYRVDRPRQIA